MGNGLGWILWWQTDACEVGAGWQTGWPTGRVRWMWAGSVVWHADRVGAVSCIVTCAMCRRCAGRSSSCACGMWDR